MSHSPFQIPEALLSPAQHPGEEPTLLRPRWVSDALNYWVRRKRTNDILKVLNEIGFSTRFEHPEEMIQAMRHYTTSLGGEAGRRNLFELRNMLRGVDASKVYKSILVISGSNPEQIVHWVKQSTVHVSFEPSVMYDGGKRRAFTPLETLLSGVGQCTGFAQLAAALIETAGYPVRLWAVTGHTFLEWQRKSGRWQLEDPDLLPPGILLPRGLSMRSLLESYPEWRALLTALPMHNAIEQVFCYVPNGPGALLSWRLASSTPAAILGQRSYQAGSVHREVRQLQPKHTVRGGRSYISLSNPNPSALIVFVCGQAWEDIPNRFNAVPGQQNLDKTNRTHILYEERMATVKRKLFALLPPNCQDFEVPVSSIGVDTISVFTMSPLNLRGQPYLVHHAMQILKVPESIIDGREIAGTDAACDSKSPQVQFEVSEHITRASDVFANAVKNRDHPAITAAAANYARSCEPHTAALSFGSDNFPCFTGRVLDAGAGTGGYAIALAEHADEVAAIDYTRERVDFLKVMLDRIEPRPNVEAAVGSVENLPYPNDAFDAIFCNGVIFLTDLPRTMAEFYRVLKPGGQVYISCNADAWNVYLMLERGIESPDAVRQGRDSLYNTVWRRYAPTALPLLARSIAEHGLHVEPIDGKPDLDKLFDEMDRHLSMMSSEDAATVRRLELQARILCGEDRLPIILADMLAVAAGLRTRPSVTVGSQAWQPEEVLEVAQEIGFTDFEWWSEAGSRQTPGKRPLELGPQLETMDTALRHFRGAMTVWHALFEKPDK